MNKLLTGLLLALVAAVSFAGDRPGVPGMPNPPIYPPPSPAITTALTSFVFMPHEVNVHYSDVPVQIVATVMSARKLRPQSVTVYVDDGSFNSVYGVQLKQSRGPFNKDNAWTASMAIPQSANTEVRSTVAAPIRVLVVDYANNGKMYTSWDLQELGYISELLIHNYEYVID